MLTKIFMICLLIVLLYCVAAVASDILTAMRDRGDDLYERDCRPHLYLSGTVEIRGATDRYVLEYGTLSELADMLKIVDADRDGRIEWTGDG